MIGIEMYTDRTWTMSRAFLMLMSLVLASYVYAQNDHFPRLKGETAKGETVELPNDLRNEWTIVGIAFSNKAQPLLEEWYEPAYLRYVAKHGLFAGIHDAGIYFVPLFVGLNKTAYEPSMKKFRKSATPEIVDHVLFSKEDLDGLQSVLDMHNKDIPYFFVLDDSGRIVHRVSGAFSDEKLDKIEEVLMGG